MKPQTRNGYCWNLSVLVQHSRFALPALMLSAFAVSNCTGGQADISGRLEVQEEGGSRSTGGSSQHTTSSIASGGANGITIDPGTNANAAGFGSVSVAPPKPAVCGNGVHEEGEACDDGGAASESDAEEVKYQTKSGDGCSSDCKTVEEGYVCPEPGKPCVPSQVCGDKKISGTENCDDGNTTAGDGCSDNCQVEVESGWTCPFVGARCIAAQCGDGILAGGETCDDGESAPTSGDGCSDTCTIESPGPLEQHAWVCSVPGQPCERTPCGDGQTMGTEQCDDGNDDTGDGCTPACRREPNCPPEGGACTSVCGDGMILPDDTDQECDDGNSADGDGCSSTCAKEEGYECSPTVVVPTGELILPVVYRDFQGGTNPALGQHPDFENRTQIEESGIVQAQLGADGKPVHVAQSKQTTTNNDTGVDVDWFSIWFRDAYKDFPEVGSEIRYNYTFVNVLTLTETAADSGTFQFSSNSFFPLDDIPSGQSFGITAGQSHNFHFTSEVRYWFQYSGNELLTFSGDDDVWVFVNKQLAVDLGGIHNAIQGSVQLHSSDGTGSVCEKAAPGCKTPRTVDFGLQLGKVYEIVVFQAERHTTKSNYTLTLSAFQTTRSICKSVCGDAIVTPDEACDLGKDQNTGAYGTCTETCTLPPYCGDENIDTDAGEECDDGVNLSAYGYNGKPACGPGCKFTHHCGDGKVDSLFGEECDDGNRDSGDGCESNCTNRPGCGNGVRDPGEECDDGNTVSGDECNEFCRFPSKLV